MTPSNLSAAVLFHISPLFLTAAAQSCSPLDDVKITFFGYPDNSPPGASLAFTQCGHSLAGGTGNYDDPITFATAINGDFNVCEIVYLPWVRKYARYEDDCEQCKTDWDSFHQYHIDLWTGSTTEDGGPTQIDCENSLPGGSQTIVRDPSPSLPTDTEPFYAVDIQTCKYNTYPVDSDANLCSVSGRVLSSTPTAFPATPMPSTLTTTMKKSSGTPQCSWLGHCLGASCNDYNDCDGQLICVNQKCASASS